MKIINPLYDTAFKYLMDNEPIAKKVMSILLNQNVISLQSKPQATSVTHDGVKYSKRYDFKAIVQTIDNKYSTVIIEVQKYKFPKPIYRFRHYLGENYIKQETIINNKGEEITVSLPIKSIYILGFKVFKSDILIVMIGNKPVDYLTDEALDENCNFAELLTHSTLIIQTTVEPKNSKNTRIEKLIRLFKQKIEYDPSNYVIEVDEEETDDVIKEIQSYLNKATLEDEILRTLRYEKDYDDSIKTLEQEMETIKRENEEAKLREEVERRLKEEAKLREEEAKVKLALKMLKYGEPIDEIATETGLSVDKILELKQK